MPASPTVKPAPWRISVRRRRRKQATDDADSRGVGVIRGPLRTCSFSMYDEMCAFIVKQTAIMQSISKLYCWIQSLFVRRIAHPVRDLFVYPDFYSVCYSILSAALYFNIISFISFGTYRRPPSASSARFFGCWVWSHLGWPGLELGSTLAGRPVDHASSTNPHSLGGRWRAFRAHGSPPG